MRYCETQFSVLSLKMVLCTLKRAVGDYFNEEIVMKTGELKGLAEHKYKADDRSFLTEVVFHYFWDWIVKWYPLWLAPNLITFAGMICNTVATLILASYSPDCAHSAPRWAYLQCAFALFIYQTLDSTDGKQARRTNTSSPLGELFDHGCDSFTQVFLAIQVSLAMSLGDTRWGVTIFLLVAIYMFYAAHWQTYATGILRFGRFDIIEAQCVIMSFLVLSGLFGPELWFVQIFGITLRRIILTPCAVMAVYVSLMVLYTICTEAAGKGGRTVADTSIATPVLPILLCLLPPTVAYWKCASGVFDDHIVLFCIAFGMVSVKLTSKVILAHMSRSPLTIFDSILLGPAIVMVNQYFGNVIPEWHMLWICLIYGFANLSCYAHAITRQICDYFKIDCFRIPYPPPSNRPVPHFNGSVANGVAKPGEKSH